MPRPVFVLRSAIPMFLTAIVLVISGLIVHHRRLRPAPALPAALMQQEPPLMLWAWETAEDLTDLDPRRTGVAFLAREVLLGATPTVRPRYQPMHTAPGTWLMAVVRIETAPAFVPKDDVVRQTALAIAQAVQLPNVRALQVDFDATASQQLFYADVLRTLRQTLPAGFPISITALVSWCGADSWLRGLPVDEAVPMFFRMGGPATTRATAPRSQTVIAERLCSGSVGLSSDEAWPVVRANQRVYLFRPRSWAKNDLARVNQFGYSGLHGSVGFEGTPSK